MLDKLIVTGILAILVLGVANAILGLRLNFRYKKDLVTSSKLTMGDKVLYVNSDGEVRSGVITGITVVVQEKLPKAITYQIRDNDGAIVFSNERELRKVK